MKYLRRFNEGLTEDDIKDYLLSFFNRDITLEDSTDNYYYFTSFDISSDEAIALEKYLNSSRFELYSHIISTHFDFTDFIIIKDEFRKKHKNIDVLNLKWVPHVLTQYTAGIFDDAKMVEGLPNNCSLISGMNYNKTMEFWKSDVMDDPISVVTNSNLQLLLYKYAI